jgi:hypothetical protein
MPVAMAIAASAAVASLVMTVLAVVGSQRGLDVGLNAAQTVIALAGLAHEMRKSGSSEPAAGGPRGRRAASERFVPPLEKGVLGGLFGGMVAAPLIALAYYPDVQAYAAVLARRGLEAPSFWRLLAETTVASAAIGVVLGLSSLTTAEYLAHQRARVGRPARLHQLIGGALGGVLAGLLTGPLAALYFGQLQRPMIDPATMLLGALPGAGIIVFSIVNYDQQPLSLRSLRNLLISLACTLSIAAVAAVVVAAFGQRIVAFLAQYIVHAAAPSLLVGGLFYGAFVGAFLGLVVGLTLILSRPSRAEAGGVAQ